MKAQKSRWTFSNTLLCVGKIDNPLRILWQRWIVLKKALVGALEVLEKPLVTRWESVGKVLVYVFL